MSTLHVDVMLRRAQEALNTDQHATTRQLCEQVLAQKPSCIEAINMLAQVAFARGAHREAEAMLHKSIGLRSRDVRAHLILGELLSHMGRYDDSVARFDRVLKLSPDHPQAIAGKADAYENSAQRDKARAVLKPYLGTPRESAEMALIQARLELHDRNLPGVEAMAERHAGRPGTHPNTTRHQYSVLGRARERAGLYDEAFDAYRRSNTTIPIRWDNEPFARMVDDLIDAFSAEHLARLPRARHGSRQPIFIVGMPRSGSTLVETILDAHPEVRGVGELPALHEIVNDMSLTIASSLPFPACAADLDQADVDTLARLYLDRLQALAGDAPRAADKYLANFRHVGLIDVLFPEARIIHTVRHPLDTCMSCYAQTLFASAHAYSYDLRSLGAVYVEYERLMAHWRRVVTVPMLDLRYEELVADQEGMTRRVLEFVGLDFDERCLRFHRTGRVVQTSSYDQVNRPIYDTSIGRWRRFDAHLDDLRAELARGGWTPEALERGTLAPS